MRLWSLVLVSVVPGLVLVSCAAPASSTEGAAGPPVSAPAVQVSAASSSPAQPPSRALSALEAEDAARKLTAGIPVSEQEVSEAILTALFSKFVAMPYEVNQLAKSSEAARVRLVEGLGPLLFGVVESRAFRELYAQQRARQAYIAEVEQPRPPRTAKEIHEQRVGEVTRTLKAIEEALKLAPASSRKQLEMELAVLRRELPKVRADKATDERMAALEKQAFDEVTASYPELVKARQELISQRLAEWPEDPSRLVATRLQEFLELTSTIDWKAQTSVVGGRMRFVDPALEAKDFTWKLCFRAGKPTVLAARAVAQGWLARSSSR